jgi:hypothetical protein
MKIFDSYEAKKVTLISLAFCLLGILFTVTIAGQQPVNFYQSEKLLNIEENYNALTQENKIADPYVIFYGSPFFEFEPQDSPVPRVY